MAKLDVLLINAPAKKRAYQGLADELAAFEPPIWIALIAEFFRSRGYQVGVLDAEAELLTMEQTAQAVVDRDPLLAAYVVYGQHPSASSQCMPAATECLALVETLRPKMHSLFMGTHLAALPKETMEQVPVEFVCDGEGPFTIQGVIDALKSTSPDFSKIKGLWFRDAFGKPVNPAGPEANIENLDEVFPSMAWDLLPMDRYKAHNWHCWDHINDRKPYASLYTSLGCPYKCSFCCINAPFGSPSIRYFSPEWVIKQIDILVKEYGVKNIKIADEMFVLNRKHVLGICDLIIERGYDLNIWAYARIDTVSSGLLEPMKKAGINWLALGIEASSKHVRSSVDKGRFTDEKIIDTVRKIEAAGIYTVGNYIFGLPEDDLASMQETLDLAIELNTEWANFYCTMAYPGSQLHKLARQEGQMLPESEGGPGLIGYSQLAYDAFPLSTNKLQAGQVLTFRDQAFDIYFKNPKFLAMMERKFGQEVVDHVHEMCTHQLKRRYAEPL
ncbi:MAG: B12-binding domain-containing radical SAM protein [Candidatus Lambdaproteobacteria bacterium RIFOXYD2_FULL_50_16]|uniref:B12-binding domain-containing radical SAM protein n=1 Tax=Candidatus Lambdaproteobacteria bacterium RIFOXYD2_FULL_50_16 TaxID=1817772 RepID=A0A1F6G4E2_9PROT|nr:MAG: B12-binding domain-containing radical SAM protein [Candidatus Lambdaproteobacteria bacterium RIFOXYD2_FULL_50_16]